MLLDVALTSDHPCVSYLSLRPARRWAGCVDATGWPLVTRHSDPAERNKRPNHGQDPGCPFPASIWAETSGYRRRTPDRPPAGVSASGMLRLELPAGVGRDGATDEARAYLRQAGEGRREPGDRPRRVERPGRAGRRHRGP